MDKEENINKKSGIVLKNHAVLSSADLRFLCRCLFELDTTDTKFPGKCRKRLANLFW